MAVNLRKNDFDVVVRVSRAFRFAGRERSRIDLEMYTSKAIGYVWGYEDGRGRIPGYTQDASWDFGYLYGRIAAEFLSEWRTSLPSIQDAYRDWRSDQIERLHGGS